VRTDTVRASPALSAPACTLQNKNARRSPSLVPRPPEAHAVPCAKKGWKNTASGTVCHIDCNKAQSIRQTLALNIIRRYQTRKNHASDNAALCFISPPLFLPLHNRLPPPPNGDALKKDQHTIGKKRIASPLVFFNSPGPKIPEQMLFLPLFSQHRERGE